MIRLYLSVSRDNLILICISSFILNQWQILIASFKSLRIWLVILLDFLIASNFLIPSFFVRVTFEILKNLLFRILDWRYRITCFAPKVELSLNLWSALILGLLNLFLCFVLQSCLFSLGNSYLLLMILLQYQSKIWNDLSLKVLSLIFWKI